MADGRAHLHRFAKKPGMPYNISEISNNAAERFDKSSISKLCVIDTVSQAHNKEVLGKKLEIISIAPLMAKAIKRIAAGQSLDFMFKGKTNK